MKSKSIFNKAICMMMALLFAGHFVKAQNAKDEKIIEDCKKAKTEFIKTDNLMQSLFKDSYGYVIFPNVGKGAIGIGGAAGNGIAFEEGKMIGAAKMKQLSIGFQLGGQAYREVIFFENEEAMTRFKENNFEFSAQASAVTVKKGATANVKYREGVMVFSQQKGGLMYEASIGGQKFDFAEFE